MARCLHCTFRHSSNPTQQKQKRWRDRKARQLFLLDSNLDPRRKRGVLLGQSKQQPPRAAARAGRDERYEPPGKRADRVTHTAIPPFLLLSQRVLPYSKASSHFALAWKEPMRSTAASGRQPLGQAGLLSRQLRSLLRLLSFSLSLNSWPSPTLSSFIYRGHQKH